jgi:hypothetical protein
MSDPEVTATMSPREVLEARLAAARQATADAKAAAAPSLEAQVAAAELEARNAQAVADAAAKLGTQGIDFEVVPVVTGDIVIVKTPDPTRFSAFQDLKEPKLADMDEMGSRCIHYPDARSYRTLVAARSGVIGNVALAAARLAGVDVDKRQGK